MEGSYVQTSRSQLIRMRRIFLAGVASLLHLLLCWIAYAMGFMTLGLFGMLVLSLVVVGSSLMFLGLTWFNLNLRFHDPSLTIAQMLWAIALVFASSYFADKLRPVFLMMVLLVLMFGAFRLQLAGFVKVGLFTIACYISLILLLVAGDSRIELRLELINAMEFLLLLVGVSLLGLDMSRLRRKLQERNRDLRQALERIQQLAITDELTGLYNRRFAHELMDQQKALADRGNYDFVLCLLDIDFFKEVNDRHGHAVGDAVLRQMARLLQTQVRDIDFIARYGGEEFLLLLSRTDEMGAVHMLDRLRQALSETVWEGCEDLRLTVSGGLSRYQPKEDWEHTLLRVDEALYRAKNNGRDQVVLL